MPGSQESRRAELTAEAELPHRRRNLLSHGWGEGKRSTVSFEVLLKDQTKTP